MLFIILICFFQWATPTQILFASQTRAARSASRLQTRALSRPLRHHVTTVQWRHHVKVQCRAQPRAQKTLPSACASWRHVTYGRNSTSWERRWSSRKVAGKFSLFGITLHKQYDTWYEFHLRFLRLFAFLFSCGKCDNMILNMHTCVSIWKQQKLKRKIFIKFIKKLY